MNVSDPRSYNLPVRETLAAADTAALGAALLSLTRELWVLADRVAITEEVLARRGIDIREEVDNFQPDAALQASLEAKGKEMISNILEALAGLNGRE